MRTLVRFGLFSLITATGIAVMTAGATARPHHHQSADASAPPTGNLSLSAAQERAAWSGLNNGMAPQIPPDNFTAPGVGALIPAGINTQPVPPQVASRVPALRPYQFTRVYDNILIVDPNSHKVVDVISQSHS